MTQPLAASPAPSLTVAVGISGASGACYGLKAILHLLARGDVVVHLVVSPSGWLTLDTECGLGKEQFKEKFLPFETQQTLVLHNAKAVGACIASGSYPLHGMLLAPCSMRTLAAVAQGFSDNLITRAADVCLKERRPLVLLPRETPLNLAHLRNMQSVTEMGGIIMPPVPAFYHKPSSVDELVEHTVLHAIELLRLPPREKPTNGINGTVPQAPQQRPMWVGLHNRGAGSL